MARLTTDRSEIEAILDRALVCRLGLCDGGRPYVVPVCFGYQGSTLYVHSSPTGRKIDVLARNPAVCLELDIDCEIAPAARSCKWNIHYRSVIGFGHAALIEDAEEKRRALDVIVAHYGGEPPFDYPQATLENTAVIRIEIDQSIGIIRQALDRMPDGPAWSKTPNPFKWPVPRGETYVKVESARGEDGMYVVADGSDKPRRAFVRGPSYPAAILMLEELLEGASLSDVGHIMLSLNIAAPEVDR